jgi:uridine kinase
VLVPLAEGRPARYQRYDWVAGRFGDGIELAPSRVLVVEGVSAIAACAEHASVRLLLDVPRSERERRWVERDGPLSGKALTWLAREDDFFARWQPPHDVVRLP